MQNRKKMAAPLKNKNHLNYPPGKVKHLFKKALQITKNNENIFNNPSLHRAIGLKTLRTLPYLANRNKNNTELMKLWESVQKEMNKNLQKHIEQIELKWQSRNHITIEFV